MSFTSLIYTRRLVRKEWCERKRRRRERKWRESEREIIKDWGGRRRSGRSRR